MIGDTMNKTKIVATIGPASQDKEILKQMILAGLDVIRINMSHADYKFCDDVISKLKVLGITIDEEKNKTTGEEIELTGKDSKVRVFAIPTNEELMIARDTLNLI